MKGLIVIAVAVLLVGPLVAQVPSTAHSASAAARPTIITGDLRMAVARSGIMVYFDTNKDGLIDEGFVLQMEAVPASVPYSTAVHGSAYYNGAGRAVVNGPDGIVELQLTNLPDLPSAGTTRYEGVGLQHIIRPTGKSIEILPCPAGQICPMVWENDWDWGCSADPDCSGDGGGGGGIDAKTCLGGGCNATDCSVSTTYGDHTSSCSANCTGGYWACCYVEKGAVFDTARCRCYPKASLYNCYGY